MRRRVFSSEFAIFTLASAIGTAAGGWALDAPALGIASALWWIAGLTLVPGLLWCLWMARRGNRPP